MLQFIPLIAFAVLAEQVAEYSTETEQSAPQWSSELNISLGHIAVADSLVRAADAEPDPAKKQRLLEEALEIAREVVDMLGSAPNPTTNEEAIALNGTLSDAKLIVGQLEQELGQAPSSTTSIASTGPSNTVLAVGAAAVLLGAYFWHRSRGS